MYRAKQNNLRLITEKIEFATKKRAATYSLKMDQNIFLRIDESTESIQSHKSGLLSAIPEEPEDDEDDQLLKVKLQPMKMATETTVVETPMIQKLGKFKIAAGQNNIKRVVSTISEDVVHDPNRITLDTKQAEPSATIVNPG